MVGSDIMRRTYLMIYSGTVTGSGTCFALDVDGRQYLITAKHVVKGIAQEDRIELKHNTGWKEIEVNLVGLGEGDGKDEVDIAVLAPRSLVATYGDLRVASNTEFGAGMDVYFLGFPHGLRTDVSYKMNEGYPLPLIKKAIISGFVFGQTKYVHCLLDGHNNLGFSGGPVIISRLSGSNLTSRVFGVISGYRSVLEPVLHKGKDEEAPYTLPVNTGIIDAHSIDAALAIIRANPIGCLLA